MVVFLRDGKQKKHPNGLSCCTVHNPVRGGFFGKVSRLDLGNTWTVFDLFGDALECALLCCFVHVFTLFGIRTFYNYKDDLFNPCHLSSFIIVSHVLSLARASGFKKPERAVAAAGNQNDIVFAEKNTPSYWHNSHWITFTMVHCLAMLKIISIQYNNIMLFLSGWTDKLYHEKHMPIAFWQGFRDSLTKPPVCHWHGNAPSYQHVDENQSNPGSFSKNARLGFMWTKPPSLWTQPLKSLALDPNDS